MGMLMSVSEEEDFFVRERTYKTFDDFYQMCGMLWFLVFDDTLDRICLKIIFLLKVL